MPAQIAPLPMRTPVVSGRTLTVPGMLAAAIITAAATAALAVLACVQIRASQKLASEAAGAAMLQATIALQVARETREAAERQWQPRVFAHPWPGQIPGTGEKAPLVADDEVPVAYYLANAGTGPGFNIRHGINVNGRLHEEYGPFPTMGAGVEVPPVHDTVGLPVGVRPIVVAVKRAEWVGADIVYWTQFENLLGERFEVRNHRVRPAEFRRLS